MFYGKNNSLFKKLVFWYYGINALLQHAQSREYAEMNKAIEAEERVRRLEQEYLMIPRARIQQAAREGHNQLVIPITPNVNSLEES